MKNKKNLLIGSAVGVICLVVWILLMDFDQFFHYFQQFDMRLPLLFSSLYVLAYFFRSLRWKIILNPIYSMKIGESFFIFMAGMLLNFLIPIRIGEIAKSFILKKNHQVPIAKSLPTIFIDKMTDLFPILLILILIPLLAVQLNSFLSTIIILLLIIYLLFMGFLFFAVNHKALALRFLDKILFMVPRKHRNSLELFFANFVDGMTIMKNRPSAYIWVYLLTLAAVFSEAFYIFSVFKAFGAHITFFQILFGYTLMNLTYILPTPPAQIGSNQFMWTLIFGFALGVDKNLTGAAVTFSHLLTTLLLVVIGSLSFSIIGVKISEAFSSQQEKIDG